MSVSGILEALPQCGEISTVGRSPVFLGDRVLSSAGVLPRVSYPGQGLEGRSGDATEGDCAKEEWGVLTLGTRFSALGLDKQDSFDRREVNFSTGIKMGPVLYLSPVFGRPVRDDGAHRPVECETTCCRAGGEVNTFDTTRLGVLFVGRLISEPPQTSPGGKGRATPRRRVTLAERGV